jgi:hypothetical protein
MRTALRLAALFVALVSLVLWLFGGPNMGRTRMSEAVTVNDLVTGHGNVAGETGFLPGIDFLAAGLAGAGIVWGASFLARRQ